MKNDIVLLVSSSLQMPLWEAKQRVREQGLLLKIEYVTDKETSETIRDILIPEKNIYTFDTYLRKLDAVLYAILMGIPIDAILAVINNSVADEIIYTLINEYRAESLAQHLDKLVDFAKTIKQHGDWENNSVQREGHMHKNTNGGSKRIQTRQQGCTLKYKRYELRIYSRLPKVQQRIKYMDKKISGNHRPKYLPLTTKAY